MWTKDIGICQKGGNFHSKEFRKKASLFLNESQNSFIGEDTEQFALDPFSVKGTEGHLSSNRLKKGKYQKWDVGIYNYVLCNLMRWFSCHPVRKWKKKNLTSSNSTSLWCLTNPKKISSWASIIIQFIRFENHLDRPRGLKYFLEYAILLSICSFMSHGCFTNRIRLKSGYPYN